MCSGRKGDAELGHTGREETLKDALPEKWNLGVETGKIGEECVSTDFKTAGPLILNA